MTNPNIPKHIIFIIIASQLLMTIACNFPLVVISYPEINLPSFQIIIRQRINNSQAANSFVPQTPFPQLASQTISPTNASTPTMIPSNIPTQADTVTLTPSQNPTLTETATPFFTETLPPEQPPDYPPKAAQIDGIVGYPQISSLDCEARSAVDFAAFYGVVINEMDFLSLLPSSDDPELGFVGNYWEAPGQIPPDSYGVHAYPVASVLRSYNVNAFDVKGMSYEDLQIEIASGRPVIVWVIGNVVGGVPVSYTASNGNTTTVARFEHTVIVIGYQPSYLTILDGNMIYQRSVETFNYSWGTLGNMAIVYRAD